MHLAIVQTSPAFGKIKENIQAALELMESTPADLYVLPELFNTGYNFIENLEVDRVAEQADGPTFQALRAFGQKRFCYIAYGFAEKADYLYNSAALIGPSGLVGLYRKVHLFDRENLFFKSGNLGFPVFDLPIGKIGMMICFDWIYPEAARALAIKGAQLIVHPSNLVLPYCPDAMVTRCLENRIFAATADRVGRENRGSFEIQFIGTSEIVSPRGEILARLDKDKPGIVAVDVDLQQADKKKINHYNDLIVDRKPEQYSR
ncbi:MAG: nitrilase-related carbon-nitrogen hydrolase [Ignavibacteria bacterium]|nr:nitrilase-related carbon-nitrogen hydrolase [Ignavibacteria bacterium]